MALPGQAPWALLPEQHRYEEFLRAGARPDIPLICTFVDAHRDRFGVVPICCAPSGHGLPIAARTYCAPVAAALKDTALTVILAGISNWVRTGACRQSAS